MTRNYPMITISEIRRFKVRFDTTSVINEPIDNLSMIEEYISLYGRGIINKITFYFHQSRGVVRKVILRKSEPNDRFRVEFRTQDDNRNIFDYVIVINKINTTTNLYDMIGRYVINPFHTEQRNAIIQFHHV
jgi:hypothetical protein